MGFYGNQFFVENTISDSLTLGEFIDLNISINESLSRLIESYDNDDNEIVEEGANLEARKAYKEALKEYKGYAKELKKLIKEEKYSDAKKNLSKMKTCVDKVEKEIKDQNYTTGSAVFGYFAYGLLNMVELLIPSFIYGFGQGLTINGAQLAMNNLFTGNLETVKVAAGMTIGGGVTTVIGGVIALIKSIVILIKSIKQFIEDIKDKDTNTTEAINLYRNKLLTYVKDLKKKIDQYEKLIDKKSKAK